ncbi:hypothetical protein [Corynebacterium kroppenstedtii]|uniref:hypothetical protein n=1 Tax=Corynebacterium kroppenstedtii TaxID=161879 RepID=UPI00387332B4
MESGKAIRTSGLSRRSRDSANQFALRTGQWSRRASQGPQSGNMQRQTKHR